MVLTLVLTSFAACWPYTLSVQTNKPVNVTFPRPSNFIGGMNGYDDCVGGQRVQNAEKQRSVASLVFHLYCRRMRLSAEAIQTCRQLSRTFLEFGMFAGGRGQYGVSQETVKEAIHLFASHAFLNPH